MKLVFIFCLCYYLLGISLVAAADGVYLNKIDIRVREKVSLSIPEIARLRLRVSYEHRYKKVKPSESEESKNKASDSDLVPSKTSLDPLDP